MVKRPVNTACSCCKWRDYSTNPCFSISPAKVPLKQTHCQRLQLLTRRIRTALNKSWICHATYILLGSNKLSSFTCNGNLIVRMLALGQNALASFHMQTPLLHLHTLILHNNRLKALRDALFQCPILTNLDASRNRLTSQFKNSPRFQGDLEKTD